MFCGKKESNISIYVENGIIKVEFSRVFEMFRKMATTHELLSIIVINAQLNF